MSENHNQAGGIESMPMTPFERYMAVDNRPAYPMSIPAVWRFRGTLDREALASAWTSVSQWYPLATSLVRGRSWRTSEQAFGPIKYFSDGSRPTAEDNRLSLTEGPVTRLNVIEQSNEVIFELLIHHAVMDGVGVLELCGDLFALYANATRPNSCRVKPPETSLLNKRSQLDREIPEPVSVGVVIKSFAHEAGKFFFQRAEAVASPVRGRSDNQAVWRMVDTVFDLETSKRLTIRADSLGATINDLAIVSMMRALAKFNDGDVGSFQGNVVSHVERRGEFDRKRRLSRPIIVNMPVLMRPRTLRKIAGCNMIGYAFLSRRRSQLNTMNMAIESLASDVRIVQKWKMAGMFVDAIAVVDKVPGLLWLVTRSWIRPATCVVSNLGDVARRFRTRFSWDDQIGGLSVGNLVLNSCSFCAPTRPGTDVTGLIHRLGDRYSLNVRVTPSKLTDANAQEILESWANELSRLA